MNKAFEFPVLLLAAVKKRGGGKVSTVPISLIACVCWISPVAGQVAISLQNGTSYVASTDLPPLLWGSLQTMGNRMTNANAAQFMLTGTTTDSNGSRTGQITIQAPGYLSYREGQAVALTYDGTSLKTNTGQITTSDERIFESFLAHFPDTVFLQSAVGGSWRRIGSHFRTSNVSAKNYTGPYWGLYAFIPKARQGLTQGQALQQSIFVAVDEQTGLIDEVRVVVNEANKQQNVTQTQFTNWTQQSGQWVPGSIVRLENGIQVLSFQTQQSSLGAAGALTAFEP